MGRDRSEEERAQEAVDKLNEATGQDYEVLDTSDEDD